MDRWTDGWTNGWMETWMDAGMDGWVEHCSYPGGGEPGRVPKQGRAGDRG